MSESIYSIEELRKAQAAAQSQGSSLVNYEQWANILQDLNIAGVESSGDYSTDVRIHARLLAQIQESINQMEEQEQINHIQPQHNDIDKTNYKTAQDSEQNIKANIVNSTSSTIMADYMKYYHLLS